jgi:hypothetical protein
MKDVRSGEISSHPGHAESFLGKWFLPPMAFQVRRVGPIYSDRLAGRIGAQTRTVEPLILHESSLCPWESALEVFSGPKMGRNPYNEK